MSTRPLGNADPRLIPQRQPESARVSVGRPEAGAGEAIAQQVEAQPTPIRSPQKPLDGFEAAISKSDRAFEGLVRGDEALARPILPGAIGDVIRNLDRKAARELLELLFPPKFRNEETEAYTAKTAPFREALAEAQARKSELDALPVGDPRIPAATERLEAAEAKLFATSGFALDSVPAKGALWVDPQFMGDTIGTAPAITRGGTPRGQPVLTPPEPLELLFGQQTVRATRGYTFDTGGDVLHPDLQTAYGPDDYMAQVAASREASGMPALDGEPIGVHVSFQGGGGRGKRYAPALMELMQHGVVPTSAAGTSVGSIAAALVAAGADPEQIGAFVTDPRINEFFDFELPPDDGGLMNGAVVYSMLDEQLGLLTGITDRPVTFADLPMPLKVFAARMSDSEAGENDLTEVGERLFEFSQELTPDTPVALAVRASMSLPGLYDPVQMVDPTTGRQISLVDGGTLDNLPVGNAHGLPEVGLSLLGRNTNHPGSDANTKPRGPLPAGNLDAGGVVWNALNGWDLLQSSGTSADDFRDRSQPGNGQFMLSLPIWNLQDPSQANSVLGFGYDPDVDPQLDVQTRELTRASLQQWLGKLGDPTASGTNVTADLPRELAFSREITVGGQGYQVSYAGGDSVQVVDAKGKRRDVKLGEERIQAMWLDDASFHDLPNQLAHELKGKLSGGGWFDWLSGSGG